MTFTENSALIGIGIGYVLNGQASINLESCPVGSHSIRATYSGDGNYAPRFDTFAINVRDLRWLPAVLQLLLSN